MASSAKNVKLGTCNVIFDDVDLGLTKGGVEVEVQTETHVVTVDQFGSTPIGELITGRNVMAKVPLAETTLDNLIKIMPGSALISDGDFATGTVTFSTAAPINGDKLNILGADYIFKTNPKNQTDVAITATPELAAEALADTINGSILSVYASASGAVVTITAEQRGIQANENIVATFTTSGNVATVGMTGGVEVTSAKVTVTPGVSTNLIEVARELKLRPIGTTGLDDFIINRAACPGALNFSFNIDQERIFQADFKGYVDDDGNLFSVGEKSVV